MEGVAPGEAICKVLWQSMQGLQSAPSNDAFVCMLLLHGQCRCAMGVRWAVELADGSSVRAQIKPIPMITARELAKEERLAHEWLVARSDRPIPLATDLLSSDEGEPDDEDSDDRDEGHATENNDRS